MFVVVVVAKPGFPHGGPAERLCFVFGDRPQPSGLE
jgi:hypothetical protein